MVSRGGSTNVYFTGEECEDLSSSQTDVSSTSYSGSHAFLECVSIWFLGHFIFCRMWNSSYLSIWIPVASFPADAFPWNNIRFYKSWQDNSRPFPMDNSLLRDRYFPSLFCTEKINVREGVMLILLSCGNIWHAWFPLVMACTESFQRASWAVELQRRDTTRGKLN